MTRRTGLVWHELYMWHEHSGFVGVMPPGGALQPAQHFDHPETKRRMKNLLDVSGLTRQLVPLEPQEASRAQLLRAHTARHIDNVAALSAAGGGDTGMFAPVGPGGYAIAALGAGGAIAAVDGVMGGAVDNAYALLRPGGHHAEADMGKGFCIFANGAIAARHAQAEHGAGRIAIVDWDVHHGNGAQSIFWDDPSVLTISIHQDRAFPPDGGLSDETGGPEAPGSNINIPLPAGSGAGAYMAAFDQIIEPALDAFAPDLIIVSSGYDAGGWDPLARMMLHSKAYAEMTARMMAAAERHCAGRLVVLHEGGYDVAMGPFLGLAVVETLSGIRTGVEDPFLMIFEHDPHQVLMPHQQAVIDSVKPALALLLSRPA